MDEELEFAKEYARLCKKYGYCIDAIGGTSYVCELCSTTIMKNKSNIRYINNKIQDDDIDLLEEESNIPPFEEGDLDAIFDEIDIKCDELKELSKIAKISTNLVYSVNSKKTLDIASDKYMSEESIESLEDNS